MAEPIMPPATATQTTFALGLFARAGRCIDFGLANDIHVRASVGQSERERDYSAPNMAVAELDVDVVFIS
jgi:hypothetical protein